MYCLMIRNIVKIMYAYMYVLDLFTSSCAARGFPLLFWYYPWSSTT